MSKEHDKDSLLGLFSTRGSTGGTGTGGGPAPGSTNAPAVRNSRSTGGLSNLTGKPMTSRSSAPTAAGARQSKVGLSALASTILREARRELGNDFNLQREGDSTGAIEESTIVKAVDKVLRRREEALDDIERANVIIHLQ